MEQFFDKTNTSGFYYTMFCSVCYFLVWEEKLSPVIIPTFKIHCITHLRNIGLDYLHISKNKKNDRTVKNVKTYFHNLLVVGFFKNGS